MNRHRVLSGVIAALVIGLLTIPYVSSVHCAFMGGPRMDHAPMQTAVVAPGGAPASQACPGMLGCAPAPTAPTATRWDGRFHATETTAALPPVVSSSGSLLQSGLAPPPKA